MAEELEKRDFVVGTQDKLIQLVGPQNEYVNLVEKELNVNINVFGTTFKISGPQDLVNDAVLVIDNMSQLIDKKIVINNSDYISAINMVKKGNIRFFQDLYDQVLIKDLSGKAIRVKTFGQRQYVQAVKHNDITFGIGPAGTGKTYLAVVMAISALKKGLVDKIVLTRPAVEAGESLGFLPGDLKEKVDPYLRPIYDALHSILGKEHTERLLDREVIEIAPLAYMRGRTLENAFVILDEAQNTTNAQMKMFLTRLGFGSKMIVNGDISQIDLPNKGKSGLVIANHILTDVDSIEFVKFDAQDVVRNPVVAEIIKAYDNKE
ncbi:PhoH family protein [Lentilactobacillus laojiaonis]|uniref:PhoH family protein n=1 Tax=Lentilactobacillus laojiaonis TaxID=2883998 RepID=UPI001D0B6181|nr:PhoH family protein [Lentilactobacillus laojiaonis]UDM31624.1 PhoH family protein [Lentilactobacillus laojiaonis]